MSSTFLGDQVIAEVKIGEKTLIAKAPPDDREPSRLLRCICPRRLVVFPEAGGAVNSMIRGSIQDKKGESLMSGK